jgi:1-acyl-sn-glycerol-3-phosphate acyltransferase
VEREAVRPADRLIRALVRLIVKIFFRRVEVVGAEKIPPGRPLVLVANHVNGLVDPILILGALELRGLPRLLAKSTLWDIAVLHPFLNLAGAIPVYRRQDEGVDTSQNAQTFARAHDLLGSGGAIALFPEGTSHSEPALKPLKTGAARIVLGAERKFPGLGVRIVPVGLLFDAKQTFRSRALVHVGDPIDPSPELELEAADPVLAARTLIARVDAGLKAVTLNYDSWDEARLIVRAADLWGRRTSELPGGKTLAETFGVQRAFLERAEDLRRTHPERVAELTHAVRDYDGLLAAFNLRDDQVAAAYPLSPVLRFVLRTLLRLLVHFPLALIGSVLNWPVYRLVGEIATRSSRRSPDQTATLKVFGAVLLYPLAWIVEALLATYFLHPRLGVAVLILAPLTGYAALLFHERRLLFWREARAYLVLRTRKRLAEELKKRRADILQEVEDLAALQSAIAD